LSRPGPCARRRPHLLTGLVAALRALTRFHEAHPDWFPPAPGEARSPARAAPLPPEWEAAIARAHHAAPDRSGAAPLAS
jgi:hypothetical protein